jgi:hypothetical protein
MEGICIQDIVRETVREYLAARPEGAEDVVFGSGEDAARHGLRDINNPGSKAVKKILSIKRKRGRH